MKRIILTTGGTGGHIFPALAVAEEIRRRCPEASILFVGGKYGPEGDLAAQAGLEFYGLPVRGFLGRGLKMIGAGLGMLRGLATAKAIMRRTKPQIVVGFGGYAAYAAVTAARWCGVPTAVHEQNSFPGLANRLLAKKADRVFISLPDDKGCFLKEKTLLTGNPIRASIAALAAEGGREERAPGRNVLVLGGSQGAKAINDAIIANLETLLDANVILWHQAGASDAPRVREAYRMAGSKVAGVGVAATGNEALRADPFIHDMAAAYRWADLAVCRAGATTIAELTAAGLPALFIPFPAATHDHQTKNARQLADAGAAELLPQSKLGPDADGAAVLGQRICALLDDPSTLAAMSAAMRKLAKPYAAAALVDELERMIGE